MDKREIAISIKPAYRKFSYFYIPVEHTGLFPPGTPKSKVPVQIETDAGLIQAELQYNSQAHV